MYDQFVKETKVFKHRIQTGQSRADDIEQAFRSVKLSGLETFFCGFMAGALSKLCTHPLDVIKKRMQVSGMRRAAHYGKSIDPATFKKGLLASICSIYKQERMTGLYKGVFPSIIKV